MSVSHHVRGVKILKAVSSTVRLQILNLLFDRGPLSYTELMSALKMNPSRDAGRFAYHLKFLLKADLLEADVEARKYVLTDLGKMVIDVADRVEQKAFKPKGMLVRTSRSTLEEFDANKIASSLVKEAKMPAELAQKVAKEAEKQLLKSKTKYLTAPLVREIVNAILIDKGLEEDRHKLTRLGLPVHEVAALVEAKTKTCQGSASVIEAAGETVLKEYTLLNIFPRDIADAHLSGALHVNGLSHWILKPAEVVHDLRVFLQSGLNVEKTGAPSPLSSSQYDFESVLAATFDVLLHSAGEVGVTQTFEYFNIFLAPFARNLEPLRIKQALRHFISNTANYADASIGVELTVPDFVGKKSAVGPSGKPAGKYGEYVEESQTIASLMIEALAEESACKPLFNPKIIVKVRSETFTDERAEAILVKAHGLASEKGLLFFANAAEKNQRQTAFSASGCSFATDHSGDWEIDTLRAGCLGCITVNLPRAAYESNGDNAKFFEILRERFEIAARALEIKYRTLRQHGRGLSPFLMQETGGDQYLRLESCSWVVSVAGFVEAVEAFCGKSPYTDEKTLIFAEETAQAIGAFTQKAGRRRGRRLLPAAVPSLEASERLAQTDIERFGIGKMRYSGTREKPFYSTISRLDLQDDNLSPKRLEVERKFRNLYAGGSLSVIDLGESEHEPDHLFNLTKRIVQEGGIEFFTYDRKMTYCVNCVKSWVGLLHKCPSCGAVGSLRFFDRFASL